MALTAGMTILAQEVSLPGRRADVSTFSPGARAVYERVDWNSPRGAAHIVGFNYQPSWAETGIKCWIDGFDAAKYRAELENGKKHFPTMNVVRIWLHHGAWLKDPQTVEKNVRTAFAICRELDLLVIPCLTSEWGKEEWGTWGKSKEGPQTAPKMEEYFLAMDAASDGGGNILVWDICNEPLYYGDRVAEWDAWLRKMCALVRARFAVNKATIGYAPGGSWARLGMLDTVDLWTGHFYNSFMHKSNLPEVAAEFEAKLPDHAASFRKLLSGWMNDFYPKAGGTKPVITNECCWGSLDDAVRARIVEESLKIFVDLGIGFLPHALQESLAPDLHRPEYGKVGSPGFMAFVMMDGSLRPGHEIFNKYAGMALNPKTKPAAPEQGRPGKPSPKETGTDTETKPDVEPEYY